MLVLVACEFSGVVREAFRAKGHDAYSCDILPSEDDSQYHIQDDVRDHLNAGWDLMIGHPPCTFLCNGGLNWLNRHVNRHDKMLEALDFFLDLWNCKIPKIALENPIGKLSTLFRKPDQILHAYDFGHPYTKDICLWLKNLPKLTPTKQIPGPYKTFDFWSSDRYTKKGGYKKSITFKGFAEAMADQWTNDTK